MNSNIDLAAENDFIQGEIVIVEFPNNNATTFGLWKKRPAVRIRRVGDKTLFLKLTTKAIYRSTGQDRVKVPGWELMGLDEESYIWDERGETTFESKVHKRIGMVTPEFVKQIIQHTKVADAVTRERLFRGAHHHFSPGLA